MDCLFCKIAKGELKSEILYETENVVVFSDIHPKTPTHLLIVPKKHLKEFIERDKKIFEEMMDLIEKIIHEKGLDKSGYRLVTNGGGAQLIDHFHVHLMGGVSKLCPL